jgi:hypothetical protein
VPVWVAEYDARTPVQRTATFRDRYRLCQTYTTPDQKRLTCWPDAATLLTIPGQSAGASAHPLVVCWEYDRSTETLSQFARKLPGYREFLTRGDWKTLFPQALQPTVRVFVVTPSPERLTNLASTIRPLPGSEAFRFAVVTDLAPASFFTAALWRTVQGEARPILRASPPAA